MIKLLRVVLDGEKIPYQGYFNNKLINAHRTFKFRDTGKFIDPNIIKMKRSFDYYRLIWEGNSGIGAHGKSHRKEILYDPL